jgi:hypothetical protein
MAAVQGSMGIVGKVGADDLRGPLQVQQILYKGAKEDIRTICINTARFLCDVMIY